MYLVFVDDSQQRGPLPREGLDDLVALGAVIMHEERMLDYTARVEDLRSRLEVSAEVEFKWKPPKGSFLAKASGDVVNELTQGMLKIAADCGVVSVVAVWDQGRTGWNKDDTESICRRMLFERIERHLDTEQELGIVICDEPGGGSKQIKSFLADCRTLLEEGTEYVQRKRILLPFMTAPSEHVAPLQLADLVTAATTAALAGHPRGLALLDLLRPLMRSNGFGQVGGYGLLLWPPPLVGLHYWIARDVTYRGKSIAPKGDPFVSSGNDFAEDCGLRHDDAPCDCGPETV
ncbi:MULTISPECIES: DUF3800 domain-containing protein [Nocardiopsis]|uniref:DUF3800 domain-containing protein n=1 Tax=Nocardiopsis TaxID=2013 RepID=UPI001478990D|nr:MULTISPECIES: DUF3800 domain-containing protein [Nocardiopsis]